MSPFRPRRYSAFFAVFLLISLSLFVPPTNADGFKLTRIDAHSVPQSEVPEIAIPQTQIKLGVYPYVLNTSRETYRLGFRIGDERFYYVQSTEYNISGDINFGFYKNYLVIDAWGYGAGRNRLMFLFKYDKNNVHLLDVIGKANLKGGDALDFISASNRDENCINRITNCPPGQITIQNLGQDNSPKVKLHISKPNIYERYDIFLKIADNRLRIDLDPELYKPLFNELKSRSKSRADAYYIYGFFAGQLSLENVKKALAADKKKYSRVTGFLERHKELDEAFHALNEEKFSLIPYALPRR